MKKYIAVICMLSAVVYSDAAEKSLAESSKSSEEEVTLNYLLDRSSSSEEEIYGGKEEENTAEGQDLWDMLSLADYAQSIRVVGSGNGVVPMDPLALLLQGAVDPNEKDVQEEEQSTLGEGFGSFGDIKDYGLRKVGAFVQEADPLVPDTIKDLMDQLTGVKDLISSDDPKKFSDLLLDAYHGKSDEVLFYIKKYNELLSRENDEKKGLLHYAVYGYVNGNHTAWLVLIDLLEQGALPNEILKNCLKETSNDVEKKKRKLQCISVIEMAEVASKDPLEEFPVYPKDPSCLLVKGNKGGWCLIS